jgi:hypothetical protein
MRRPWLQNKPINLLFGLTDESVQFRNKWRGLVGMSTWLILSGFTMILTIFGVHERLHVAMLIGMSLVKYIPMLMVVYALARVMAARYLDDVYELNDEELASAFLEEVTFGHGREGITINEGRISEQDERSPLILIGGPGSIQVNLDSVALVEKVDGEPGVIHPRNDPWGLGRFERIREIGRHDEVGKREYAIINLRDQFVSGLSIKSRTKDGIPIEAQDIKIIFSILRRQQAQDETVQGDAYLFEPSAVESLVYNQTLITPEPAVVSGISFPWNTTIIPLVLTELEELITSRTLSELLATIGQKEVDESSTNDQTIAQMRVEMTGHIYTGSSKEIHAPNFESRSKITAQFYDTNFKQKAAKLGVSLEWIDIGTWQLPSDLILEKHKEAWTLSRENAKIRATINRSRKKHELEEVAKLVTSVVIGNYEQKNIGSRSSDKDGQRITIDPEIRRQLHLDDTSKKDPNAIAVEMLKAFRMELLNAKMLIENENNRLPLDKRSDLINIEKALYNINFFTMHWVNNNLE